MFFEAMDLYGTLHLKSSRTGVLNLLKHVAELLNRRSVFHRLYSFSNATSVAHVQSRNKNN